MPKLKPTICNYEDYRLFLKDIYTFQKHHNASFSHRYIAQKVGFKSAGHFSQILSGKLNISIRFIEALSIFFKLKKKEAAYFQTLVLYNQSKTHKEKQCYFQKLLTFKENQFPEIHHTQNDFYSCWYYGALRELLHIYPFNGKDYLSLSKQLYPKVPENKLKKAIEVLFKLDLVKMKSSGHIRPTNTIIKTTKKDSLFTKHFVSQHLDLAQHALNQSNYGNSNHAWISMSISENAKKMIIEELRESRQRILKIVEKDEQPNQVFHLNSNFFPLSNKTKLD